MRTHGFQEFSTTQSPKAPILPSRSRPCILRQCSMQSRARSENRQAKSVLKSFASNLLKRNSPVSGDAVPGPGVKIVWRDLEQYPNLMVLAN